MIVAHFMQLFLSDCDKCGSSVVPLVLLGVSYAIYAAAIWGGLPYLVEQKTLGSAFGIVNVAENLGTIIAPPIMGRIEKTTTRDHGFFWVQIFLTACSVLSLVFNLLS